MIQAIAKTIGLNALTGGNKKTNTAVIITGVVVAGVILFAVSSKVKQLIKSIKNNMGTKSEIQILYSLGMRPTYNEKWYDDKARSIYNALWWTWYSPNCDETETQRILGELKNDLDFYKLNSAFGIKDNLDMVSYIDTCLNVEEKESVNSLWSSRGIQKRL